KIRKIFVSPGPIFEPMGPEVSGFHAETGLFAGGFRPGDVVINTFSYHLTPAAHEIDESLNLIGCSVVPTGVGQTEIQVSVAKAIGATGYVGTPSFLMTVLAKAKEMGVGPLPFQVAQVGAEPFTEAMRRELADQHRRALSVRPHVRADARLARTRRRGHEGARHVHPSASGGRDRGAREGRRAVPGGGRPRGAQRHAHAARASGVGRRRGGDVVQ